MSATIRSPGERPWRPTLLRDAEALLRRGAESDSAGSSEPVPLGRRLAVLVAFGAAYGAVMGSYNEALALRPTQMLFSALKVPLMLAATFALSLPAFFVLNTLLGLRRDLPKVVAALTATQAGLTVILASLGPVVAFVYVSGIDYQPAILLNGLMFATASFGAQVILWRSYRGLVEANPAHRLTLRAWLVVYVFVGIQMGWILRPFIGDPGRPTQFFRDEGLSNAYVAVFETIRGAMGRDR